MAIDGDYTGIMKLRPEFMAKFNVLEHHTKKLEISCKKV